LLGDSFKTFTTERSQGRRSFVESGFSDSRWLKSSSEGTYKTQTTGLLVAVAEPFPPVAVGSESFIAAAVSRSSCTGVPVWTGVEKEEVIPKEKGNPLFM